MGGKSRKSGGVSKALINRIKQGARCGKTTDRPESKGLLDGLGNKSSPTQQLDDGSVR